MASPRLIEFARRTRGALLEARAPDGHWEGRLSSSALAAAVAVCALQAADETAFAESILRGIRWLIAHQNPDGGWGDSPESPSNPSTTVLAWCALALAPAACRVEADEKSARAAGYLAQNLGGATAGDLVEGIQGLYGTDRTFAVPILALYALSPRAAAEKDLWRRIPALPFELSLLPPSWFRFVRLSVVSYALPALIAVGLVQHRRGRRGFPAGWIRDRSAAGALRRLHERMPANGGFLEAIPLTSFVSLCLCAAGERRHPVVAAGTRFLVRSQRSDGSWPIDTHLATWLTTGAVDALGVVGTDLRDGFEWTETTDWLLRQQYRTVHPFTRAAPGGWSWTPEPGGVPDADDTSGALLALRSLADPADRRIRDAARRGLRWLLDLQNADGGIPTFCRGWGRLPFDRSSPDITAHALRAWRAWRDVPDVAPAATLKDAAGRALRFLWTSQDDAGSWTPLWFGNQHAPGQTNPVWGAAQVLRGLRGYDSEWPDRHELMVSRARGFLLREQNDDGGWGGVRGAPSSIEETGLALAALSGLDDPGEDALARGTRWLIARTDDGRRFDPAPVGLYFAKLWYSETLYPLQFSALAARSLLQAVSRGIDLSGRLG